MFLPRYKTAIVASRPTSGHDGWEVWIDNYNATDSLDITAYAVCSAPL